MSKYSVLPITYEMTEEWILKIHYAGRMPSISYAFGLFKDGVVVGVVTYGKPASPFLCMGVCGEELKDLVYELNRLVLKHNDRNEGSMLVGRSLKMLPGPMVVVSYADTGMGHVGYVYQATNWLYTGATKERTDMFSESGHSRHNGGNPGKRQHRTSKHRYVTFVGNKRERREMIDKLNYPVKPYPKGKSKRYNIENEITGQQIAMVYGEHK